MKLSACRVFVDDLAAARAFYRDVLRLPLVAGDDAGYCVVDAGAATVVIEAVPADAPDEDRVLVGRFTGLSFEVHNMAAAYDALTHAGVAFAEAPERQPWGGTTATFFDPAGNALQLVEYPR